MNNKIYQNEHSMKPEDYSVELPYWMWKQIIVNLRHSKRKSEFEEAKEDAENIEKEIVYQINSQSEEKKFIVRT